MRFSRGFFGLSVAVLSLGATVGCGGGAADAGLTDARKLQVGNVWDYQRTTTTIQNGSSSTNNDSVRVQVGQRTFQGQSRLAFNFTPAYTHAASQILSQDSFNNQAETIGVIAANGTETALDATYLPGKLNTGDAFSNMVITPTGLTFGNAQVGREETITTFAGNYIAKKVVTSASGVTCTSWIRPGLGVAVKTVIVETGTNFTRTTEYVLTASSVKG